MSEDEISKHIVHSAFEVHKVLGPGLLESAYEACLIYELNKIGLSVEAQKHCPLNTRMLNSMPVID